MMNTKIPFEKFRVLATGEPFAVFQVSVQPALWSRQAPGDDSVEKQCRFISDAIREKIEREQGEEV
jgi:hypothetical protein